MDLQTMAVYAGGALIILIALLHVGLPALWGWYREIKNLSPQSRKTIIDRNSFLILYLLVVAYLAFAFTESLQTTDVGRALLLWTGVYWVVRALWRFIGFPKGAVTFLVALVYLVTGIAFLLPVTPTEWIGFLPMVK